jgi:hypothetical protein
MQRPRHNSEFKAHMVFAALRENHTMAERCEQFGLQRYFASPRSVSTSLTCAYSSSKNF